MNAGPATPQRPLPGTYFATPGPVGRPAQPVFGRAPAAPANPAPQPQLAPVAAVAPAQQPLQALPEIQPIERAARTVNDTLTQEARYPDLDSYITRECLESADSVSRGARESSDAKCLCRGNIVRL